MKMQIIVRNPNQLNDRFVARKQIEKNDSKQLTYLNSNKFIVSTIDICTFQCSTCDYNGAHCAHIMGIDLVLINVGYRNL